MDHAIERAQKDFKAGLFAPDAPVVFDQEDRLAYYKEFSRLVEEEGKK